MAMGYSCTPRPMHNYLILSPDPCTITLALSQVPFRAKVLQALFHRKRSFLVSCGPSVAHLNFAFSCPHLIILLISLNVFPMMLVCLPFSAPALFYLLLNISMIRIKVNKKSYVIVWVCSEFCFSTVSIQGV